MAHMIDLEKEKEKEKVILVGVSFMWALEKWMR